MCATHSRYVVDLNRDPSGAALYAGADNTEFCPTRTFADEPIYAEGDAPSPEEIDATRRDAISCPITRRWRRRSSGCATPWLRGPARRPFDSRASAALFRGTAAGPESRHGERRELRPALQAVATACWRRRMVLARRQRPLQGRLDHAPLRAAARRRARAAARDGAGLLHGRGAALPLGPGQGGAAHRRAASPGARADRVPAPAHDPRLHRAAALRRLPGRRPPQPGRHQGARVQPACVEHRRRRAGGRRAAAGVDRARMRPRARADRAARHRVRGTRQADVVCGGVRRAVAGELRPVLELRRVRSRRPTLSRGSSSSFMRAGASRVFAPASGRAGVHRRRRHARAGAGRRTRPAPRPAATRTARTTAATSSA